MSRRARSRLLAREMKRATTYLAIGPEQEPEDDGEGNAPDVSGHGYACPCCQRQEPEHFWCGICSTGATQVPA